MAELLRVGQTYSSPSTPAALSAFDRELWPVTITFVYLYNLINKTAMEFKAI